MIQIKLLLVNKKSFLNTFSVIIDLTSKEVVAIQAFKVSTQETIHSIASLSILVTDIYTFYTCSHPYQASHKNTYCYQLISDNRNPCIFYFTWTICRRPIKKTMLKTKSRIVWFLPWQLTIKFLVKHSNTIVSLL